VSIPERVEKGCEGGIRSMGGEGTAPQNEYKYVYC
jgi:hypothetical protein